MSLIARRSGLRVAPHFAPGLLRSACTAIILVWAVNASGFALDATRSLTQYAHRVWTADGLPQPTIYAIQQTSDGFLWIGTQDGLVRFDGVGFTSVSGGHADFEHSLVRALATDSSGTLWAASVGSGILEIRPDGSSALHNSRNGLPSDDVFCLVTETNGAVWACTNQGLALYRDKHWRTLTTDAGLPSTRVRAFCRATDGTEWVATAESPLSQGRNGHFSPFEAEHGPPVPPNTTSLVCANDGVVWVGTENGLFRIAGNETRRFSTQDGLLDNAVAVEAEGPHGSLWVGTRSGVNRLRPALDGVRQVGAFSTAEGLSHSGVQALFIDREGSLWAGTKGGLDHFTNGNLTLYTRHEAFPGNHAGPVAQDSRGHIWVGVPGRGIAEFDGRHFHLLSRQNGLAGVQVTSMAVDEHGDVWAGSEAGVNLIHDGRAIRSWTASTAPPGHGVSTLFFDRQNVLWAGTKNGLSTLQGQEFVRVPSFSQSFDQDRDEVTSLFADAPGSLFVATAHRGLYMLDDASGRDHPAQTVNLSNPLRAITAFHADEERRGAWLTTLGSGLVFLEKGRSTVIRTKDGLYDSRIYGVVADEEANYWFASSKGVFSVSRNSLHQFVDGRVHRIESHPFQTGQLRFECEPDVQPAALRDRTGRLWFATDHGLLMIDPAHLQREEQPFPVQVTSTLLNGQPAHLAGLRLSGPFPKNLEIRYAGLLFDSQLLTFRYQLAGYDKTWIEAGTRRSAFYTSLPPGHFQFRVQARDGSSAWVPGSAPLDFDIEPRLTQRPVFWAGLATLLGILILAGYRIRVRHLTGRFDHVLAERERIARELHDTLLQGLAGITMQLQALSGRLREPDRAHLANVIEDARLCSAEARSSLLGLRSSCEPADDLRSELETLVQRVFRDSGIALGLRLERSPVILAPQFVSQLLRIGKEALFNAARHAKATRVDVTLRFGPRDLVISITDDGIGFDPEMIKPGHFGLVGMRERATRMGATVDIISAADEGTHVAIRARYRQRVATASPVSLKHFIATGSKAGVREKQG